MDKNALVRLTRSGPVSGIRKGGVLCWLGVPYAQAERFGAPEQCEPWDDVRPAHQPGPRCSQPIFGGRKGKPLGPEYGEDCLVLNIWAPEDAGAALKPVLVSIHGGAFMVGHGMMTDGTALACDGDVVVVSINYRLGVLGFVNFGEALGLPSMPSNLGLRDQIAALEWIRDNIAAFGGDPRRVTINGESAGSIAVGLLMLAPKAWPLFHGAIMQSGAINLIHDHGHSVALARKYLDRLGLDRENADRMRTMPVSELLAAQAEIDKGEPHGFPAAPWYGDDLLPASLADARTSPTAAVPLIAGATRDEIRLFDLLPMDILPRKRRDLEAILQREFSSAQAMRVIDAYPCTKRGRRALATDLNFVMPTQHFAERHSATNPTWVYRFDYAYPLVGAFHGLDMMFLWRSRGWLFALARGGPFTGRRRELSERMTRAWLHFVHHSRPADDWPAYDASSRKVRLFNLDDRIEADPEMQRRTAWAGQDAPNRQCIEQGCPQNRKLDPGNHLNPASECRPL